MGLERRAAIAEHLCPITTPARPSSWVASPRQPLAGIVTNRATTFSCTTRLRSLIRGHNRPPEEVTLAVYGNVTHKADSYYAAAPLPPHRRRRGKKRAHTLSSPTAC